MRAPHLLEAVTDQRDEAEHGPRQCRLGVLGPAEQRRHLQWHGPGRRRMSRGGRSRPGRINGRRRVGKGKGMAASIHRAPERSWDGRQHGAVAAAGAAAAASACLWTSLYLTSTTRYSSDDANMAQAILGVAASVLTPVDHRHQGCVKRPSRCRPAGDRSQRPAHADGWQPRDEGAGVVIAL